MKAKIDVATCALALPAVVLLVFFFYPLLQIGLLSLRAPEFSSAEYRAIFENAMYLNVAWRTLSTCALVTLFCLVLGYPTAAFIASLSPAKAKLVLLCVAIPYLTSFLVRSYGWVVILGDEGLVNHMLQYFGFADDGLAILYTRTSMMIGIVHVMLPMMILPIYASMLRMDTSLLRAAKALGGGPVRTFFAAYFPQTANGVLSGCMLVFIVTSGFYITPAMLGGLSDVLLSNLVAVQVTSLLNFSTGAALAVLLLTGTLLLPLGGFLVRILVRKGRDSNGSRGAPRRHGWSTVFATVSGFFFSRLRSKASSAGALRRIPLRAVAALVCIFLVLPSAVVIVASFTSSASLDFPPQDYSLRWYRALVNDAQWRSAASISFQVALAAMAISTSLGLLAAYGVSKISSEGRKKAAYAVLIAPLVVPSVVFAIAMFGVLAQWGLIGTREGLIVAHTVGCIPYVFVVVYGALLMMDPRLEMAAQSLGATRARTIFRVVLPTIGPALVSGAVLAFIHSFDEVVITSFVAGVSVETLPLKMWVDIQNKVDPTIAAVSTLLILIPVAYLVCSRGKLAK
ncbi:ABC transporter permease subunit [Variovorax boronicumulans]|uniref:ABC transporter permease subunit n=1 Tax=Variovorax boronicumulans TaxID=436515 RepID=UPI001C573748